MVASILVFLAASAQAAPSSGGRIAEDRAKAVRQNEAKTMLREVFVRQRQHFNEHSRFSGDWDPIGEHLRAVHPGSRYYVYALRPRCGVSSIPANSEFSKLQSESSGSAPAIRRAIEVGALQQGGRELKLPCKADDQGFVAVAVGNLDADPELDVWWIDETKVLNQLAAD